MQYLGVKAMISKYNPFFIVGCGRSGTTLLRLILINQGDIIIPPECNFLEKSLKHFKNTIIINDSFLKKYVDFLYSITSFSYLNFDKDFLYNFLKDYKPKNLYDCIELIYIAYMKKYNKKRWGDKNPFYVLNLDLINNIFPDSKVIHVIRDGRDVALSYKKTKFGPPNMFVMAKRWEKCIKRGKEWGQKYPDRYLEVHYEKLITNTESEIKKICDFINLEYKPSMINIDSSKLYNKLIPSQRKEHHKNLKKSVIKNNYSKWKKEMSLEDLKTFEWVNKDILKKLGYETNNLKYSSSEILQLYIYVLRHNFGNIFLKKIVFNNILPWRLRKYLQNYFFIDNKHYSQ